MEGRDFNPDEQEGFRGCPCKMAGDVPRPSFLGYWKVWSAPSQHREPRAAGPEDKMQKVLKDTHTHTRSAPEEPRLPEAAAGSHYESLHNLF